MNRLPVFWISISVLLAACGRFSNTNNKQQATNTQKLISSTPQDTTASQKKSDTVFISCNYSAMSVANFILASTDTEYKLENNNGAWTVSAFDSDTNSYVPDQFLYIGGNLASGYGLRWTYKSGNTVSATESTFRFSTSNPADGPNSPSFVAQINRSTGALSGKGDMGLSIDFSGTCTPSTDQVQKKKF